MDTPLPPVDPTAGFLLVGNPKAGSTARERLRLAAGALSEHGPTELRLDDAEGSLERAIAELGERTLVVAGGDGSAHHAVGCLARAGLLDRPVGVLGAGTGNDLARNLGLPMEVEDAAQIVAAGHAPRRALLETGDGELVVNNAHLGLGVHAAQAARPLKSKLGRFAYPVAGLAVGARHPGDDVTVTVDGVVCHRGPALAVVALVGAYVGGGLELVADSPADEPGTPTMEVLVVGEANALERLGLTWSMWRHELSDNDTVTRRSGRTMTVQTAEEPGTGPETGSTEVDLDGEFRPCPALFTLSVSDRSWRPIRAAQ